MLYMYTASVPHNQSTMNECVYIYVAAFPKYKSPCFIYLPHDPTNNSHHVSPQLINQVLLYYNLPQKPVWDPPSP